MQNKKQATKRASTYSILKPLIKKYMSPYWGQLGVAVFFMVIAALSTALFAKLLQPILDSAMIGVQKNPETIAVIYPLGFAILSAFIVRGFATYLQTTHMNKISQHVVADIQRDVFSHFMTLDLSFFHNNRSGQLVSRVTNDVSVMRAAVSDSFIGIGYNLLTLIFLFGVMLWQDWELTLITLVAFPVASGLVVYLGRRLRKVSKSIQNQTAHLMGVLTQIFQGVRQVQAYGMEEHEKGKAGQAVNSVRDLNIKSVRIGNLSTPINETMVGLITFAVIVYGGHRIAEGLLTPGGLISFIAAFGLAYEPMKKLAKLNNSLQLGVGAAERVLDMMAQQPHIKSAPNATDMKFIKPSISFSSVLFRYDGQDAPALNNISFDAPAGKVTALVGASGSGKSTLLNLLLRFYDVQSGEILVDGKNIQSITISSLRKNMALVSQDVTIFDDTLAANIGYGNENATMQDIIDAAKLAEAHKFIQEMPQGFNTIVGEHGVRLSGGQRQRIALARAIIRNAPILLLDEATSALDNESERLIQSSLQKLQKDKTTLVIAHRLSTIQNADQILVFDHGQIVERGTHDELLAFNGHYKRMHGALISHGDVNEV
jgi:subfamily B ATP-binding cassette protein MsbA